jgi:asparagine synthase (glutamine-hydrolysing)
VRNFHFVKPDAASLLRDIHRFTDALTEPVSSTSEYAEFRVMEMSKQYVTVLLNGQGADEIMAGYLYFAGYFYKELFKKMRWGTMLREMFYDVNLHKRWVGPLSFLYFMMPSSVKERLSLRGKSHVDREFKHRHCGSNSVITDSLYDAPNLHDSFIRHFEHKFEHHLLWADRSGMWFSLETRFPFLDHTFVERTLALQSNQLIRNGWNKHILREAMKGVLPEAIRMRPDKIGYETPEDAWFRSPGLAGIVGDAINSKTLAECGFYDINALRKLYRSHLEHKANAGQELWKALNLYLWLRKIKTINNA